MSRPEIVRKPVQQTTGSGTDSSSTLFASASPSVASPACSNRGSWSWLAQLIPAFPPHVTLLAPRLTRGRCRRALQCETRAARRRRPRSVRARPRKERRGRTRALPAAVPGDPFLRRRARMPRLKPLRARPSRPAPLTSFQPGAPRAGGRRVPTSDGRVALSSPTQLPQPRRFLTPAPTHSRSHMFHCHR